MPLKQSANDNLNVKSEQSETTQQICKDEKSDKVDKVEKVVEKMDKVVEKVVVVEKENTSVDIPQTKPTGRSTMRGKAALLLNLDESSSDEDTSSVDTKKSGIYGNIIQDTLKEKVVIKNQKLPDVLKSPEPEKSDSSGSDSSDSSSSQESISSRTSENFQVKKSKLSRKESVSSPSPPPSPVIKAKAKPKRKSTTLIDRQLKALAKFTTTTSSNVHSFDCDQDVPETELEADNMMTIRVSTKTGMHRFEMNKNNFFLEIFEKIAELEDNTIENLMLKIRKRDLKINYQDTPLSLNHFSVDVIDCEYIKGKKQERIQFVENEDEDCDNQLLKTVRVILQTSEGRKSRLKFLVAKDEPLKNIISKYCEKREIKDSEQYMLEFDGDVVSSTETAEDLDLDGDEIFDIKKSSKPTMQLVAENKKNYEFDDDILIV